MLLLNRLLGAGGADSINAVLYDLDVNNSFADSLGNLPWPIYRNLVTMPHRNTTADRSRCGHWADTSVGSNNTSSESSISISVTLCIASKTAIAISISIATTNSKSTSSDNSPSSKSTTCTITSNSTSSK